MRIRKSITREAAEQALAALTTTIAGAHPGPEPLLLLGIANGGLPVAARLADALAPLRSGPVLRGAIDCSFHRDDIGRSPIPKEVASTSIPADVEGATVLLVDDVLCSGRTVRAALEEVFALGRPARVDLAVLVDRGNRRLPIEANFRGFHEPTAPEESVKVDLGVDPAIVIRSTVSTSA
ncbi:MAG: bifunctional pyr operon transcriptional regulator/uracil phosphoribosyltransferase PyrR [Puniceicoccaceae bacterium]|nr:MAG: bifunctional pyr operon transcriptional regulator/uracil phosphoribosyltransferase PyrR [Puniceicoccaceae bacterium]